MKDPKKLFALSSMTFFLLNSFAASATTLDQVVVSGSRIEQPLYEVPQAASVVTSEEIEEAIYRTTPEALVHEPGVMVQKTAHGHGSPFIRGLTGKEVLILVDGVRLNNSTFRFGPNQYINTIDPAIIERVEVVRGPGSVLYGSDALGGVINIITKKRKKFNNADKFNGEVNAIYGSADEEKTLNLAVEGDVSTTAGYWANANYRDFNDLRAGGDEGVQKYTGYNERHANAVFSKKTDADGRLDLSVQYTSQNDVPRTDKFINSNERRVYDPQARFFTAANWQGKPGISIADKLNVNINYQKQSEALERQKFGATKVRNQDDAVHTMGFSVQADKLATESHMLTYGFEMYRDVVKSSRVDTDGGVKTEKSGSYPDNSKYSTFGLYVQDEFFITNASILTTGLRFSANRAQTNLTDFGKLDETYKDITGSVRLSHELFSGVRTFAGIAQGFRAPNLDDIAVLTSTNEGVDVPSPGLKSEKSLNYELGLKLNLNRVQGTAAVFYSDYTDIIDRKDGTYQGLSFIDDNGNGIQDSGEENVRQKFNIGNAEIYGVELDGELLLTNTLSAFGNFAWTYGQNLSDGEPLSRIPPARLLAGLRWQASSAWWVEPFVEAVDGQDRLSARDAKDPRIADGGTPGYYTFNARAGWKSKAHVVNIALNNISDKLYKVHGSGVYGPGREVKVSYLFRF